MRKISLVLAVLLAGHVAVCRADGNKFSWKSLVSPYAPAASSNAPAPAIPKDAVIPADVREIQKDDVKDYVEPVDAKDVVVPAPAAHPAPNSGIVCAAPADCRCGRGAACGRHFWEWLTYRPLSRPGLAGCCHKCGACHVPPLYLYFLDPYHACAPGNGCATCAAPGCSGCAHP